MPESQTSQETRFYSRVREQLETGLCMLIAWLPSLAAPRLLLLNSLVQRSDAHKGPEHVLRSPSSSTPQAKNHPMHLMIAASGLVALVQATALLLVFSALHCSGYADACATALFLWVGFRGTSIEEPLWQGAPQDLMYSSLHCPQ